MNESEQTVDRPAWRDDLLASIVVFLVALPLCMGIAIASGCPPERAAGMGIITGIIGGILVGLIGGSPMQVSGPAAGLSVMMATFSQQLGWETMGLVILLAGLLQLIAGLAKLGYWFRAVSPAVIQGMLSGIGVLIFASQFHIMIDDAPSNGGLANLLSIPEGIAKGLDFSAELTHEEAFFVGIGSILILMSWKWLAPKSLKMIPGPLVAVLAGVLAVYIGGLPIKLVDAPNDITQTLLLFDAKLLQGPLPWTGILIAAGSLALIASAETLLSAVAVDKMKRGSRTNYDKELAAQGLANMICGWLGALPMTGVIVRSAANVEAGARTKSSAILHGIWLLVFVMIFPSFLRLIPMATLAAILVYTGYKLLNWPAIVGFWKQSRSEFAICVATLTVIVVRDLLTGVAVGFALSLAKLLYSISHLKMRLETRPNSNKAILYMEGTASFLKLPRLAAMLDQVPPNTDLHVHLERLRYIDHACLDLFVHWKKDHEAQGGSLTLDWDSLGAKFRQVDAA